MACDNGGGDASGGCGGAVSGGSGGGSLVITVKLTGESLVLVFLVSNSHCYFSSVL